EPHPLLADCLRKSFVENGFQQAEIVESAVGREKGEITLYLDETDSGGHSLDRDNLQNNRRPSVGISVPVTRLDDWIRSREPGRVDVIKIDVQGHEDDVL